MHGSKISLASIVSLLNVSCSNQSVHMGHCNTSLFAVLVSSWGILHGVGWTYLVWLGSSGVRPRVPVVWCVPPMALALSCSQTRKSINQSHNNHNIVKVRWVHGKLSFPILKHNLRKSYLSGTAVIDSNLGAVYTIPFSTKNKTIHAFLAV